MKIALVQYYPEFENKENNIITVKQMLDKHLTDEDIVVFPEMTLTGYTMKAELFAEEEDGAGLSFFISEARKRKKHFFAGIIEKDGNNYFNTVFHIDRNGLIAARYRKIHLFSFAEEEKYYKSSSEPVITKADDWKIGLSVCYDLRFPELFRFYAKIKCDAIINIANWPVQRIEHWKILSRARALENLCYFIGVNRTGSDPFNNYSGNSVIFGPRSEEILTAGTEDCITKIELLKETVINARIKYPFLDDIKLI
ncbi:MAG: carbon-nitrogen family hydrolase [Ignavibacteria bacterium]|nr:carbon-nitrogen family hydrolase [Ignavibacteria bacterium]